MNNLFEQLIAKAKRMTLTQEESARMRRALFEFMESRPARFPEPERLPYHQRSYAILQNLFKPALKPMPIIIAIALLASGGISFAAEGALPGDTLYPVKIEVNEKVRGWLALSPEAEARLQTNLLERRLRESETLAGRSRLNASARAEIETRIDAHADQIEANLLRLNEEGRKDAAARISSDLETSLKAHLKILGEVGEQKNQKEARPLILKIEVKERNAAKTRANLETDISAENRAEVKTAAEGRMKAAENKVAETVELLEKVKMELGAEALAEAEARLRVAADTVAEGKAKLEAGLFGNAFALFQKAHRLAQEAKLLLEAQKDFGIGIDLGISAETETEGTIDTEPPPAQEGGEPGESQPEEPPIEIEGEGEGTIEIRL